MAIAKVLDGEPFGAGSLADVPAPEPDEDDVAVLDAYSAAVSAVAEALIPDRA